MSFVENYRNDLFVSYSHVDNLEIGGQRCISVLVRQMRSILQQRLSRKGVDLYWDESGLRANQVLDAALRDEVESSAVMLAIVSPGYLEEDSYTRRELEWFLGQPGAEDRLFVLELLPNANAAMPDAIRARKRFQFWRGNGEDSAVPMILDPTDDRQLYMTELTKLCTQVRDRLVALKQVRGGVAAAEPDPAESSATVLLCQTTDDLEYERGQVSSTLQQFNIRVLPEMDYPQGGNDFRDAFAADLARADLVVQLLGQAGGRMPADMPDGYIAHQCEAAQAAGRPLALWRHPDTDPERIDNPVHRAIVSRPDVVACGLEAFKTQVQARLTAAAEPVREVRSSLIFIGADRSDMALAEELLEALSARGLPVAVPIFEGTPEEIQQDLNENLIDSDSVLFVHGAAPTTWVRGFLRRLSRSMADRAGPPDHTAMVKAPPPKTDGLNFAFPNLQIIDCSDVFDTARIVAEMEARP